MQRDPADALLFRDGAHSQPGGRDPPHRQSSWPIQNAAAGTPSGTASCMAGPKLGSIA